MLLANRYYLIALLFILSSCANDSVTHIHSTTSNDIDNQKSSSASTKVELNPNSLNVGELDLDSDIEAKSDTLLPNDIESNN